MTKDNLIRVHRIYNIFQSASIIIAGICFICGCLSIYYSGDQPYSREAVAQAFSKIAIPVYICLALVVIGFIFEMISPLNTKAKSAKAYAYILARLKSKKDMTACDKALLSSINKERNSRKLHSVIRTVLICAASAGFLIYALNGANFGDDINASVISAMWILIPCLVIPFGYSVFAAYRNEKSLEREIELIKNLPASSAASDGADCSVAHKNKMMTALRIVILVIGVAALVYGFIAGGTADVLTKAINICTECIGLG